MNVKVNTVVIFIFFVTGSILWADGYWAEIQKNSYRTGRADLSGDINEPQILWKYYRGGYINPSNVAVDDAGNIYFSINGAVKAFSGDAEPIWSTSNFGAGRIFKITDLDKNGERELLVAGTSGIRIISVQNGSILSTVSTESPSFIKIADVNEDGFDDILVRGRSGTGLVAAYDFSGGAVSPFLLWQITENIPVWGFEICVGDINNDGKKELVFDRMDGGLLSVFEAFSGSLLIDKCPVLAGSHTYGFNQIINVDGDSQNEFVFSGGSSTSTSDGSFSITVYDFVEDKVQWQYEYGYNGLDKGFRMIPGSISDFNGDGIVDIAVSVFNDTIEGGADKDGVVAPDIWTTLVYRADNGVLQTRMDNTYLEGFVDLDLNGTSEFILRSAPDQSRQLRAYTTIGAYELEETGFRKIWSKDRVRIMSKNPEDNENEGVVFVADVPVILPTLDGEGFALVEDIDSDGEGDRFFILSGSDAVPSLSDAGFFVNGKNLGFISTDNSKIYFSGNDGFIYIFDRDAVLKNERKILSGSFNGDTIFINSGTGGKVLSTLSTFSHISLDVREASLLIEPETEWMQMNQFLQPLFALDGDGDGTHEFISLFTWSDGSTDIFMHRSNGGLIWGQDLGKLVKNPSNFISGDFDGDGLNDLAFTFVSEEEGERLYSLKGSDGTVLNNYNPVLYPNAYYSSALILLGNITGSGNSDEMLLFNNRTAQIIQGELFDVIDSFNVYYYGNNPSVSDFNGDNINEIFANQREGGQKQMFYMDGSVSWTLEIDSEQDSLYKYPTPYPGISKINGDDGFDIALGGKFGDVSAYSGVDGTVLWRRCLYDGSSSDISVGVIPTAVLCSGTTLSNIVTGDIDGDSLDEFVTGDKLGNLYVINSKDGTLKWTMKFNGAIGNPALADVNDDGKIEILVGAGDGFLYAVGQRVFVPAPEFVRDVAVIDGEISANYDIDEMVNGYIYGGFWKGVDSALRYDVKLTDHADTVLREAVVTGANQIVFDSLELNIGDTLYLNVRTINSGGYDSDWAKSNGVTVVDKEIVSDDDIMPDEDASSDDDVIVDTDTGPDAEHDEDSSEDTDATADKDNIADIDTVEDTDLVIDENTADDTADELYEDTDTAADQEVVDNDDGSAIRSKNSGCGCSVL